MIDYNRKLSYERETHRMSILVLLETLIFIKKMLASVSCYFMYSIKYHNWSRERIGSVVECLTRDREAAGLSLTGVTALWSLSKTHLSWLSTGSTQEDPYLFN